MRVSLILVFILSSGSILFAQDIHFTQFYHSPMNLNPASTGDFGGDYRFVGNQRRQWVAVSPEAVPYNTFGGSVDAADFLQMKNTGAGLSIYNDKAGYSRYGTLQLNLAGAYSMPVNKDSTQHISGGIQTGFTHRSISYDALSFDRQYNGYRYDASLSTGETPNIESFTYLNLNAGFSWQYLVSEKVTVTAGVSLFNITKPRQSLLENNTVRLDRRVNIHANARWAISEKINVYPQLLFMKQGKFRELLGGVLGEYVLKASGWDYRSLFAGILFRAGDAGALTAGMHYQSWKFGVSYDLNYSGLNPASNYRGGLELSVIYILKNLMPEIERFKACPAFI